MLIHKDIIIRIIFGFIFFAISFWVLGQVFYNFFKKKLNGDEDADIDTLIRRQKERLRSQYGLPNETITKSQTQDLNQSSNVESTFTKSSANSSKELKQLYQETQWGGGTFVKELQLEITKNYSYTLSDSKINAFILLCEKRNYLRFLSEENRNSKNAIKNYLITLLIFFLLIEEAREKNYYILEKIAKKIELTPVQFALALQIKLLMSVAAKKDLKEDRIFSEQIVLSQYSEDTMKEAIETVLKKEANLWAKSPSLLFEELTLALNYSSILTPIPKLKHKKDFETACSILGINEDAKTDDVKKIYKKIALIKHPDKIVSQKLPKILEQKGIERFNQIQEAYEVILAYKK